MNLSKVVKLVACGAALALLAVGAMHTPKVEAENKNQLTIDGSTTVGPICKAFSEYYMKQNKDVKISVSESGSSNGAKSLLAGTCDIAAMSRFMKGKEFKAAAEAEIMPVAHVVALDGLAVVVHPSNALTDISMDKLQAVYKGEITNWKDLGGPDSKIVVISRDSSSGTFETFNKLVMKKEPVVASGEVVGSNGAMRTRVGATRGAIGYVGLGYLDKTVKDVTVNRIPATARTIQTGAYPIARPLFLFTNGYPTLGGNIYKFCTLHLTKDGEAMVNELGFVPVTSYVE